MTDLATDMADRLLIRELVENWALWRDAGDWERFRTCWHDDGRMMATWFQGSADDFIKVSREGFERGVSILHFLGGCSIDLEGDRAVAQTKMTISQRAKVHEVPVDVVCTGRFYDFVEKRDGRRIHRVHAVLFVDRLAQHHAPAAVTLLHEVVEAAGADDIDLDAMDLRPLADGHLGLGDSPVACHVDRAPTQEVQDRDPALEAFA